MVLQVVERAQRRWVRRTKRSARLRFQLKQHTAKAPRGLVDKFETDVRPDVDENLALDPKRPKG
jgi:hypothetical protein